MPLRAVCGHGHRAPAADCRCGVHAARAADAAVTHLVGRDEADVVHRVLGQVALWGTVVEGEHGWRGELAYPTRLLVPTLGAGRARVDTRSLAAGLAAYSVPVEAVPGRPPILLESTG